MCWESMWNVGVDFKGRDDDDGETVSDSGAIKEKAGVRAVTKSPPSPPRP